MPDNADDVILTLKSQIEQRLQDQIARHHKINPNIDPRQVVDIQIAQENEKLERMFDKFADEGENNLANFVRSLIDEWLPELAHDLKHR